jgi:hypothetical protein
MAKTAGSILSIQHGTQENGSRLIGKAVSVICADALPGRYTLWSV